MIDTTLYNKYGHLDAHTNKPQPVFIMAAAFSAFSFSFLWQKKYRAYVVLTSRWGLSCPAPAWRSAGPGSPPVYCPRSPAGARCRAAWAAAETPPSGRSHSRSSRPTSGDRWSFGRRLRDPQKTPTSTNWLDWEKWKKEWKGHIFVAFHFRKILTTLER